MDENKIIEIDDNLSTPNSVSSSSATKPEPTQKLLKDVLDRYLKSQCELAETIVELFQRHESLVKDLENGTKRQRSQ